MSKKINFDKTQTFSRVFHPKIDNFHRKSKLNFWTKNEDFEQCDGIQRHKFKKKTLFCYRILSRHKVILSIWRIFMWNPIWKKRKHFDLCQILQHDIKPIRTKSKEEMEFLWSKDDCWYLHIVWKLLKMSHLNFWILAFSTNFCPIITDLSGNTVWPQALSFQKLTKLNHF